MDYVLKERIGKPELFTGRKEELAYFLKWINDIKEEKSQSTAVMARCKMGKTAIMERLFNITFYKNDGVIPFYYVGFGDRQVVMYLGDRPVFLRSSHRQFFTKPFPLVTRSR